jgi:undecaprenyl-diphosphatase
MNPLLLVTATLGDKIDSAFYAFDMWVYSIFGAMQCSFLTVVAKMFTAFGDEAFVIPMAIVGIVLCFFKKTRKYGFAIIFAIAIGTIVTNVVVKPMVLRIRPYNTLQNSDMWAKYQVWYKNAGSLSESDYSFPSGHTTAAFEMAIATALCLRSSGKKGISWLPPIGAVCVMGSRVYLMVHYASDVIGGFIVGTCAGVVAFFLSKLVCLIFSKVKFLDAIDVEKIYTKITKKEISSKLATGVIVVVICALFCVSFIPALSEGGDSAIRCDYVGEYTCYNEAKVDVDENGNPVYKEDYPEIEGHEGEYYCKIHYKQLVGDTE